MTFYCGVKPPRMVRLPGGKNQSIKHITCVIKLSVIDRRTGIEAQRQMKRQTRTVLATVRCHALDLLTQDKRHRQPYRKCQSQGIRTVDRQGLQVCKTI